MGHNGPFITVVYKKAVMYRMRGEHTSVNSTAKQYVLSMKIGNVEEMYKAEGSSMSGRKGR